MNPAHTRNPHDRGFEIATGQDIAAGTVIAAIYWDAPDEDSAGLVIRWRDTGEESLPDDADEAIAEIAAHGYALDASSIQDIRSLSQ